MGDETSGDAVETISEHEAVAVKAANATGKTPVVFIHGLWLLPSSWGNWAGVFEEAGYAAVTPVWPAEVIGQLQKKPAVMGHSTGGLLTQIMP